jgi:hypothetical protein
VAGPSSGACGSTGPCDSAAGRQLIFLVARWGGYSVAHWRTFTSDPDAAFDRVVEVDASDIVPQVTWGTSPEMVTTIDGRVPDPKDVSDPMKRESMKRALHYMGLVPNTPIQSIKPDKIFIGSCTNSRIEDLRAAAHVVKTLGRHIASNIRLAMVVPGSGLVKAQAEREGLDKMARTPQKPVPETLPLPFCPGWARIDAPVTDSDEAAFRAGAALASTSALRRGMAAPPGAEGRGRQRADRAPRRGRGDAARSVFPALGDDSVLHVADTPQLSAQAAPFAAAQAARVVAQRRRNFDAVGLVTRRGHLPTAGCYRRGRGQLFVGNVAHGRGTYTHDVSLASAAMPSAARTTIILCRRSMARWGRTTILS